jgi:hypothetical protein
MFPGEITREGDGRRDIAATKSRSDEGDFVMGQIFGALAQHEMTQSGEQLILDTELASTQVSPWPERTRYCTTSKAFQWIELLDWLDFQINTTNPCSMRSG